MMFAHKDPAEIDPIVTRRVSSGKAVERRVQVLTLVSAVPALFAIGNFGRWWLPVVIFQNPGVGEFPVHSILLYFLEQNQQFYLFWLMVLLI